jgi:hypothetical protein
VWKPLGVVAEIEVSEETFQRCVSEKDEAPEPVVLDGLAKYRYDAEIDRMFGWYVGNGFGRVVDREPNTGVYVKMKVDGSKVQVISDRSLANEGDPVRAKSFEMFGPEDMKRIMRKQCDIFFSGFDISNFFHGFVVSKSMRERVPVLYRWVKEGGEVVCVEALRLVFGSKLSPVISHSAACNILGIPDSVFVKSLEQKIARWANWDTESSDVSGMYVDDFLEASTTQGRSWERAKNKMSVLDGAGCGFKDSASMREVRLCEFAGRRYCGKAECLTIGNTESNKVKGVAMMIKVLEGAFDKEAVESFVGSISFLGMVRGWCFPFLNRAKEWCLGKMEGLSKKDLVEDLFQALVVACIPWSPRCQVRWFVGSQDRTKFIFTDAQVDFGRMGLVWWVNGVWCELSLAIPAKYLGSQQSAELYAIKKAVGFGMNEIGREFVVVSDSVGSILALCRPNMGIANWRRNQLLRSMVKDQVGKDLMIWCAWIQSASNPADNGSRVTSKERRIAGVYEGDMESVFSPGTILSKTEFYNRACSGVPGSEVSEGLYSDSDEVL